MALAEEKPVRIREAEETVTALDCIIEGLERELALERELGERTVEFDRSLLLPPEPEKRTRSATPASPEPAKPEPATEKFDFVFLHDRPLSADGVAMMAKIVTAMGKSADEAPIVFDGEMPPARIYVVLGSGALGRWFPGERGSAGSWIRRDDGSEILVSRSPEYVLRISAANPELKKIKAKMWSDLKDVLRRLRR